MPKMKTFGTKLWLVALVVLVLVVGFIAGVGFEIERLPSDANTPLPSYTNTTPDEIVVFDPSPGRRITSPYIIEGQARGSWFFEAIAPVILVDWDGRIIAEHYIEAQGNWMTEEFVPFTGTLNFENVPVSEDNSRGAVILRAANASGLPEYDRAIEIPIRFRAKRH